jgi:hypothetical protein
VLTSTTWKCPINGASLCQVDLGVGLIGSVVTGSGSGLPDESVVGVEPTALDCSRPLVSSRARLIVGVRVAQKAAVNSVGELSFQAAQGFPVAFPGCAFALVMGPTGGVVADLGDGHDVQAGIELAVSCAGQPVAHDVTGGHLDRRGAGVGSKRRRGAKSADGADPDEDLAGEQVADSV